MSHDCLNDTPTEVALFVHRERRIVQDRRKRRGEAPTAALQCSVIAGQDDDVIDGDDGTEADCARTDSTSEVSSWLCALT